MTLSKLPWLGLVAFYSFSLTSCEKSKELLDSVAEKVTGFKFTQGEAAQASAKEVKVVSQLEGEDIIKKEKRLVILEFYTDT